MPARARSLTRSAAAIAVGLAGAAAWAEQPALKGVHFDRDTYAVVPDWPRTAVTQLSVAAWVKVPAITDSQVMLNRGAAGGLFTFYFFKGAVRMLVEYRPGSYTHATAALPARNTWTHYVGTYDGKVIRIYRNGVLAKSQPAAGRIRSAPGPLYIGALAGGVRPLDGELEHAAVWRESLTAQEAAALASGTVPSQVRPVALTAHWHSGSLEGDAWRNTAGKEHNAMVKHDGKTAAESADADQHRDGLAFLGTRDDGYRGIWYMNQPSNDEYVYKYSGGLGTYCAKHRPFAVYAPAVNKTFFCYGGATRENSRRLIHMVSCYDHTTGTVPRPFALLDKKTDDAHDNPVISLDADGFIWIFSTSHGTGRPSYIHRSTAPYSIDAFELVPATRGVEGGKRKLITNFSYMQPWYIPGKGFICFFTRYNYPAARTICCMTSPDGVTWSEWRRLGAIHQGHYQVSAATATVAGTAFNYHPAKRGLNWRTNLYYLETRDFGETFRTVDGRSVDLAVTTPDNAALVHDYASEKLNVYMKDICYDENGRPIILYVTSKGYQSGPANNPRTWTTARWTGTEWEIRAAMSSDNNYDMGPLYLEKDGTWRLIGPTETGPQPFNPGGEIAMWTSSDKGKTWQKVKQLTSGSDRNHTYVRRPVNAHPDFYGLWADGHGRQPSESCLYFCDRAGNVRLLPREMTGDAQEPQPTE